MKFLSIELFSKYIFFSGIATLIDLGLLYLLTSVFGLYYLFSAVISYACGMVANYSLNKFFSFKNKSKQIAKQFSVFAFVALIGLGLNQFILWVLVEFFSTHYLLAKIVSISIVVFWSFFGHKRLTFGTST